MLMGRSVQKQKEVYTCVIDCNKAFETVKHESLVELLLSLDVDEAGTLLLISLYWNLTAALRYDTEISNFM